MKIESYQRETIENAKKSQKAEFENELNTELSVLETRNQELFSQKQERQKELDDAQTKYKQVKQNKNLFEDEEVQ